MGTKKLVLVLMLGCILALSLSAGPAAAAEKMDGGGIVVMAEKTLATVEAVDKEKRMLTLKMDDGTSKTVHVGKEAVNFDQISAGDKINATMVDAVGVSMRKSGMPPNAGEGAMVALAPKGAMPGMVMADTDEVTGKVKDVEHLRRMVEIEGPAGNTIKVKMSRHVDMKDIKKGDDIVVRVTRALVLKVEKP